MGHLPSEYLPAAFLGWRATFRSGKQVALACSYKNPVGSFEIFVFGYDGGTVYGADT